MINKKYKLSIIVPIYNIEDYLEKCLKSLCNQTYQNLEIILVDDGSTDKSGDICDEFVALDDRFVVIHKKNENLVRARKTGIDCANGEYLAFVDGDDWVEPDMYESLMKKIIDKGVDFVDSGYIDDEAKKHSLEEESWNLTDDIRGNLLKSWMFDSSDTKLHSTIWTKVFKREVVAESYLNVPDWLVYSEDIMNFIFLLVSSKSVYASNYCGYHYVTRNNSISNEFDGNILYRNIKAKGTLYQAMVDNYPYVKKKLFEIWYADQLMMETERLKYFDNWGNVKYVFKNINELFWKKLVIYGAGKVGRSYYEQISKYNQCNVVAWVDSEPNKYNYDYCAISKADCLEELEYDLILIAVYNERVANDIADSLMERGVKREMIYWSKPLNFLEYAKEMALE